MPLFTLQSDVRLPMMTQIVQVEQRDVQAFLARGEYIGLGGRLCSPMAINADLETQAAVLSVRDLAREILKQRVNVGKTDTALIARLGVAYGEHSPVYTITVLSEDAEGFATGLRRIEVTNNLSAGLRIVLDDLISVIEKDMRVLTCEECGNPFVPTRAGLNRYCSTRCGNRVRARKYLHGRRDKAA